MNLLNRIVPYAPPNKVVKVATTQLVLCLGGAFALTLIMWQLGFVWWASIVPCGIWGGVSGSITNKLFRL